MAKADLADVGDHVEPDERESRDGWLQQGTDASSVPDDLDVDAARNDDRDGSPAGIDVQVDDLIVELRFREIESDAAQIGADVRVRGELPPAIEAQPSHARMDLERPGQAPAGGGECDRRRQ